MDKLSPPPIHTKVDLIVRLPFVSK
jgi:hypothetical protein